MIKIELLKSVLRPFRMNDAKSIVRYADNPKIARFLRDGFPQPYTLEAARTWLEFITSDDNPALVWAITRNDEAIGAIGVHPLKDVYSRTAELGYWLGEPFWGQGIISEAIPAAVRYAFDHTDLVRIHASVFEGNPASMRVLEKAGFYRECIRNDAVFKNNAIINDTVYVTLKRDQQSKEE